MNTSGSREEIYEQPKYRYQKKLGSHKAIFQGKPENYYTLSNGQVSCAVSVCFSMVICAFWICVGFFYWVQNHSTYNFVLVWSIILIIFILFFMITAFICSRGKMEQQQRLIRQALQRQVDQKKGKNNVDEFELRESHNHLN